MTGPAERDRDIVTWLCLAAVGVAAAVMSFTALSDLARLCGSTGRIDLGGQPDPPTVHVAWLLPVAIDALAIGATRVWVRRRAAPEAVQYARRAAWAAIVATVGGNAYHGALVQSQQPPPLAATVLVSAAPAVALGVLVHLTVLRGRAASEAGDDRATSPGRITRWRAAGTAWWEMRKAERKAADGRRADTGETGRTPGGPPVPTGADSNEVLAADLRRLNADRRAKGLGALGRDAVRQRYGGLGSTRAQTVREMADRPELPDGLHVVPSQGEASA